MNGHIIMDSLIYSGDSEAEIKSIDATISNYGWHCAVGAVNNYRCKCADIDLRCSHGATTDCVPLNQVDDVVVRAHPLDLNKMQ